MKVIVAGSREIGTYYWDPDLPHHINLERRVAKIEADYAIVERAIRESGFEINEVASGTARGVDRLGERWAAEHRIPVAPFPADWKIGKNAGILRNAQMAEYAEAAIVIILNGSRGSTHMANTMKSHGKPVYIMVL